MTVSTETRIPTMDLRLRMILARYWAGLGIGEIAARTRLSRQTIGNYENGRTHPSRAAILLWAVACGVSVDWLETGEPDPENPGPGLPITYTATDLNCEPADYVFSAPTLRAA